MATKHLDTLMQMHKLRPNVLENKKQFYRKLNINFQSDFNLLIKYNLQTYGQAFDKITEEEVAKTIKSPANGKYWQYSNLLVQDIFSVTYISCKTIH